MLIHLMQEEAVITTLQQTRDITVAVVFSRWYMLCLMVIVEEVSVHLPAVVDSELPTGSPTGLNMSPKQCGRSRTPPANGARTCAASFWLVTSTPPSRRWERLRRYATWRPWAMIPSCVVPFCGIKRAAGPSSSSRRALSPRSCGTTPPECASKPLRSRGSCEAWATGYGEGEAEAVLTHQIWSDNFFFYAGSERDAVTMWREATEALAETRQFWKPGSLFHVVWGETETERLSRLSRGTLEVQLQNGHTVTFEMAESLDALGVHFDGRGTTPSTVAPRLTSARRAFFQDIQFYKSRRIPKYQNYRHFSEKVQGGMLHACGGWAWTKQLVDDVMSTEARLLKVIARVRKEPDEEPTTLTGPR